jgi:hypothetical protein
MFGPELEIGAEPEIYFRGGTDVFNGTKIIFKWGQTTI